MNLRPIIDDLLHALNENSYEQNKQEFDRLADAIVIEEKDKYFKEHPDEAK